MTKVNWWMISFIAIAVLWGFREGCGCRKGSGDVVGGPAPEPVYLPGVETVIIDTQYVPVPDGAKLRREKDTAYIPDAQLLIGDPPWLVDYPISDREVNFGDFVFKLPADTSFYRDSLPVSHGYAIIQDTVSENRIKGRGFRLNQELPVVEKQVPEKKRNVVYLGLNAAGSKENYFYKIGGDISLLTKGGKMYSIGSAVTTDNRLLIEGGVRWPLRFGSKR